VPVFVVIEEPLITMPLAAVPAVFALNVIVDPLTVAPTVGEFRALTSAPATIAELLLAP
jgi:hypothetical protein